MVGDDGTVVERGVFEEEGFDECGGGEGVDALASVDEFVNLVVALEPLPILSDIL